MKNTVRKFISALLIAVLSVLCVSVLFACHKRPDPAVEDARKRGESVAYVKDAVLRAIDENWRGDRDNASVSAMDNAGDYVVANEWADMICGVLKNSSLQTGKLTYLKDAVDSESGKDLLENFAENAELVIPLMREANFTSTDISNLFYDLLCALVSDSGEVIDRALGRLNEVKNVADIGIAARDNINKNSTELSAAKAQYVPSEAEREEMLSAFSEAKAPMGELISFAYNMSINSITDNIFDALFGDDGALGDITDGEIGTIVRTLISSVNNLKSALGDSEIAALNAAARLIIDKFDSAAVNSVIYRQIVGYAKYIDMVIDVIPAMCDVVSSAGGLFEDASFVQELRAVAEAELGNDAKVVNTAILLSRICLQIGEDFGAEQLGGIIDKIAAKTNGEYNKTLPLIALDIMFNASNVLNNPDAGSLEDLIRFKHPDIGFTTDDLSEMIGIISLSSGLEKFKQTYHDFKAAEAEYQADSQNAQKAEARRKTFEAMRLACVSCGFDNLGVENPFDIYLSLQNGTIDGWYNYYLTSGVSVANEKARALCPRIVRDLKLFIADFYAENSQSKLALQTIAYKDNRHLLTSDPDPAKYEEYVNEMADSDLFGVFIAINMIKVDKPS